MRNVDKPYAPACDRNRDPILTILRTAFADRSHVLEIGSGTGQHAVYFGTALPHLIWQPSDRPEHLPGIRAWVSEANLPNVRAPIALDVLQDPWPAVEADAAFSANTAHILSWEGVVRMFEGIGRLLPPGGVFCLYGPFHEHGRPTAESNARFDAALRTRDPASGIRDQEAVDALARNQGFAGLQAHLLPANNRCLIWTRT